MSGHDASNSRIRGSTASTTDPRGARRYRGGSSLARAALHGVPRTPHHPRDRLDRHPLRPTQPTDLRPVLHAQHPPDHREGVNIHPPTGGQFSAAVDTREPALGTSPHPGRAHPTRTPHRSRHHPPHPDRDTSRARASRNRHPVAHIPQSPGSRAAGHRLLPARHHHTWASSTAESPLVPRSRRSTTPPDAGLSASAELRAAYLVRLRDAAVCERYAMYPDPRRRLLGPDSVAWSASRHGTGHLSRTGRLRRHGRWTTGIPHSERDQITVG